MVQKQLGLYLKAENKNSKNNRRKTVNNYRVYQELGNGIKTDKYVIRSLVRSDSEY